MYLENIKRPNDIKRFDQEELPAVASEIRHTIIDTVSKSGGHLASNLGAVEITLALHYIMQFPEDRLIFDVGHQSYTHKLLTGRGDRFSTIRTTDGLSGFPCPKESECDPFYEGHASGAIGQGVGLACARKLSGKNHRIAVVAGDGALTGGLAYEAMNNAADLEDNLTIILNDNEMSISRNVGGISRNLSALRTSVGYAGLKQGVTRTLEHIPFVGEPLIDTIRRTKSGFKQLFIPEMFFEDMGILYLGPVDGHDIDALIGMIRKAFTYKGACIVHAVTKKGQGFVPAMKNPSGFHGTGPFDRKSGIQESKKQPDYSDVFGHRIYKLGQKNNKICAVTAAMTDSTGLALFRKHFPDRLFDVGIAESHGVIFASALAREGFIPFVAIYSTFLQRAYDQIMMDVCLNNTHVIFAVDRAGLVGADGATHQGLYDIVYLSSMPNMILMAPKNKWELSAMLVFASRASGPVAIRYPRGTACDSMNECRKPVALGKCEIIKPGSRVMLFALGSMVETAVDVAKGLAEDGVDAMVVNARFAKPLDSDFLKESLHHEIIVTMEEGIEKGGFGMQTEALLRDLGYKNTLIRIGADDRFVPHGSIRDQRVLTGLDTDTILARIRSRLGETNRPNQNEKET